LTVGRARRTGAAENVTNGGIGTLLIFFIKYRLCIKAQRSGKTRVQPTGVIAIIMTLAEKTRRKICTRKITTFPHELTFTTNTNTSLYKWCKSTV